jgi:D-alanyl-D-alanine carboxypeptidase
VIAAPAGAAPASASVGSGADPADLQGFLEEAARTGVSGVLAELRDERFVWRGSAGVARLDTSQPVPVNGRFRAGSVTKSFVATVLLQLVGERRLRLADPVERWLPGLLPAGDRITLEHLAQHTSGIVDYPDVLLPADASAEDVIGLRDRSWRPRELVDLVAAMPLLFEPGTSWSYSNTNYILLGMVIRRVTGNDHRAEVQRRILRPLRLRHTELPGTDPRITGPHSHGYLPMLRDGEVTPVDVTVFNPSIAGAAGELVSTAADLNRFYGALLGGRLLRPDLLAAMKTTTADPDPYGLGLFPLTLPCGEVLWGHTGGFFGYETFSMGTADGRRQLTISINPWGEGNAGPALNGLIEAAFCGGEPPAASTGLRAAPDPLRRATIDRYARR